MATAVTADRCFRPAAESSDACRTAGQAEIDQEINQALQQLQEGGGGGAARARSAAAVASPEASRERRHGGRLAIRVLDVLSTPIVPVFVLLEAPVRWLPGIVRQLLGYVAAGTALVAGALWVYILAVGGK